MKEYPFSILKEDFENSSKEFVDNQTCPLAIAFKRQFPKKRGVSAVVNHVRYGQFIFFSKKAILKDPFSYLNFMNLQYRGIEFHTTITL